ncbi:NAD-dependent epimerase/dehydratase family protein [Thermoflexus sp.]|uniref:NAD-dependent epimerase/dehydratase family protein n=1 Tax=Thermoflexus sp. TaxID=1969742 RepID=UPI002ADD9A0D|nr:NAD-dependent epimerase/dehydratase family protein [Thermoflexus sp.]
MTGWRILITGGAGFIGANLVRRFLTLGAELHLVVRPEAKRWRLSGLEDHVTLHPVDVRDGVRVRQAVEAVRPHAVFHLAMPAGHPRTTDERLEALTVSVMGTAYLLEAAGAAGTARFVHVGSSLEYEPMARSLRESDPLRPNTDRGLAKMLASRLVEFYARFRGVPAIILRPFSVYGPWESPRRFIPTLLRAALRDEEIRLTAPGYRHDWIFVADVVEACCRALEASVEPGEAFNIGTGVQWSNEEVVAIVEALVGRPLRRRIGEYPPSPPDRTCWVAEIEKAQRSLGWSPAWDLPSGLRATLTWMQDHLHLYTDDVLA